MSEKCFVLRNSDKSQPRNKQSNPTNSPTDRTLYLTNQTNHPTNKPTHRAALELDEWLRAQAEAGGHITGCERASSSGALGINVNGFSVMLTVPAAYPKADDFIMIETSSKDAQVWSLPTKLVSPRIIPRKIKFVRFPLTTSGSKHRCRHSGLGV